MKNFVWCGVLVLMMMLFASCSGGGNMVTPDTLKNNDPGVREVVSAQPPGPTSSLGLWQVVASKATGKVDVVQLRSADKMLNALGFLEPPALKSLDLDWPNLSIDFGAGTIDVGVKLTHPFGADSTFTGFDVRGVVFGPRVANADGYTIVSSPEYFSGVPFGYKDGMLGSPDSYANFEGMAGYKYYCDNLGATDDLVTFMSSPVNVANRGKFSGTSAHQRDFRLEWGGTGYDMLIFNYAVYANYDWPVGSAPFTLDSFPISSANSAEAFCINATETANSLYFSAPSGGGSISLDVEVWDWQNDVANVTIESAGSAVIPQTSFTTDLGAGSTAYSKFFQFSNVPGVPTAAGDIDLLVTVTDSHTFGECWFMDLLPTTHPLYSTPVYATWIYTTTVSGCPLSVVTQINPTDHDPDNVQFGVTITGNNFLAGPSLGVKLRKTGKADIVATSVLVANSTSITCNLTIPLNAASGGWDVEVTNGCGTAAVGAGIFGIACVAPIVTGSNPNNHSADGVNFNVGISGKGFINGADLGVRMTRVGEADIIASNVMYLFTNYLTCTFNIPFGTAIGQWSIVVTNGCGTQGIGTDFFTVNCPTPSVTSINPGNHLPDGVTYSASVYGTSFYPGGSLEVKLQKSGQSDILATGSTYVSSTQVNCSLNIPVGTAAGTWDVSVTSGCGATAVGNGLFTVTCPSPGVTSINPPSHLPNNTLFAANIYGSNFYPGGSLGVKLTKSGQSDITATGVTFINSGQVNCNITLPTASAIGDWNVVVTNGCGTPGTGNGLFQVTCPPPTSVSQISPGGSYANGSSILYNVSGSGFMNGPSLAVTLKRTGQADIIATNVTFASPTSINCNIIVPVSAAAGLWNVEVVNGCGLSLTGSSLFKVYAPVTWSPSVNLSGPITKARATTTSAIPDGTSNSNYLTAMTFNVTGSNANGGNGGPYTYQYYVSQSGSAQTGSPVGWINFTFANGGNFNVAWDVYASIAPSRLYLWVRSTDGSINSTPVVGANQIQLSRVVWQSGNGVGLTRSVSGNFNYDVYSTYSRVQGSTSSNGTGYQQLYINTNFGASGNNTLEWYLFNTNSDSPNCYTRAGYGNSFSMSNTLYSWTSPSDGLRSYNVNSYTGSGYFGFYQYDNSSGNNNDSRWDGRYIAFYENPS